MMSEEKTRKFDKKYIYIIAAAIILIGIIVIPRLRNNNTDENLITAAVERGELIATVGGTGKVEANKSATLKWQTSGFVETIDISTNDEVKEGQVLSTLMKSSLPQSVILAEADLVNAQRNLETVLDSESQISQIYIDLLDAEQDAKNALEDIDAWNYKNAEQAQIDEARQEFITTEEDLKAAQTDLDLYTGDLEDSEGEELQAAVNEAQEKRDNALRNLNFILGKAYDTQVAKDYAEYDLAVARLEDAQREWDKVKEGQNEDDIRAAQAQVTAAEAMVGMAKISAPFEGTITAIYANVGDDVNVGTNAFRIDDLSRFFIEVDIAEIDIQRIEVGQEAEFTFDALLEKTYHGQVVEVASAGTEVQGDTNFIVKLLITDSDEDILPGMTASVSITVTKYDDALIVPNRAIRLDNGDVVVYVLRDGNIEKEIVEIGASSDTSTQILSGNVVEGDVIVLNPPEDVFSAGQRPAFTR